MAPRRARSIDAVKVEVFRGKNGEWYYRTIADNGLELDRSSEGYVRRIDAVDAAQMSAPQGAAVIIESED